MTLEIDAIEARLIKSRKSAASFSAAKFLEEDAPALCAEVRELRAANERLLLALKEYDRFNRLHNDLEAYLSDLSDWAQGELPGEKPTPENHGLELK